MVKLHMLKSIKDDIGMSFIIESEGEITVIDGGFDYDAHLLSENISKLGGKVHTWIITHAHEDHIDAFIEMMRHGDYGVKVERIICKVPPYEKMNKFSPSFSDIIPVLSRNWEMISLLSLTKQPYRAVIFERSRRVCRRISPISFSVI